MFAWLDEHVCLDNIPRLWQIRSTDNTLSAGGILTKDELRIDDEADSEIRMLCISVRPRVFEFGGASRIVYFVG